METEIDIEKYLPLCHKLSMEYKTDLDIALLGLVKAQKTYNGSSKFVTYAYYCIRNEILMQKRKDKKHNKVLSIENLIEKDCVDVINIQSNDDVENECLKQDIMAKLWEIKKRVLKPREEFVLNLYLIDEMTQQEIADKIDKSQVYVCRLIKRALIKIKREFENENKRFDKNE